MRLLIWFAVISGLDTCCVCGCGIAVYLSDVVFVVYKCCLYCELLSLILEFLVCIALCVVVGDCCWLLLKFVVSFALWFGCGTSGCVSG